MRAPPYSRDCRTTLPSWLRGLAGAGLLVLLPACHDEPTAPDLEGTPEPAAEPDKLRLSMHAVRIEIGEDTTIVATVHDAYGYEIPNPPPGYEVAWASTEPAIATVTEGVVRAIGAGGTTVSATAGSLPVASMVVEVLGPEPLFRGYEAIAVGRLLAAGQSNAWDINNSGEVAGWSSGFGGRAMRWTESEGLVELAGITTSRGINDEGTIVGFSYNEGSGNPDAGWAAYVFRDGKRTDLPSIREDMNSQARRINSAGTVVGRNGVRAVVWHRRSDGTYEAPVELGLGNHREGPVINDHGDIAFTAWSPDFSGLFEPVLWRVQPDGSYGEPLFLGRPAGGSYFVNDIGDDGLIVGYRYDGAVEVAVFWHPNDYSAPVDLGVGEAWGTNSRGDIVGVAGDRLYNLGGGNGRPVIWVLDGWTIDGPHDLGMPYGFEFAGARAINDEGWIVGSSWGPSQIMATLWRPEP